jgi:hypothetical protein
MLFHPKAIKNAYTAKKASRTAIATIDISNTLIYTKPKIIAAVNDRM